MNGITREDRIRNKYVRGSIGVTSIVDKMSENKHRWFGDVNEERKFGSYKDGYGNEY